ncbi:divalent-cation tolerance protein CutA [Uliginosibacterium gangwonense]|uniref:divalent-cation tolerance protein CutA n=1 Tax=Uliginosibacterium gangwonense TaxID=392736 RepID=UPI0003802738|nr:divalent-cation tolerance protein CutA [Uliginosibacterium gangwonense]
MPSAALPLIVLCNAPDQACAEQIAQICVERRLAACVNILAPCQSVYRWQGKVERATEIPLLIKTTEAAYPALEALVRSLHPYEVPEIIALCPATGLPAYLNWLATETDSL